LDVSSGPKNALTRGPGTLRGRFYTTYVDEVKTLYRTWQHDGIPVEMLLRELIEAVEEESRADGVGAAPWYYEKLADVYRKRKDPASERAVLERFVAQRHAPGASPPKLLERLASLRRA
jgi:hypothetical protein